MDALLHCGPALPLSHTQDVTYHISHGTRMCAHSPAYLPVCVCVFIFPHIRTYRLQVFSAPHTPEANTLQCGSCASSEACAAQQLHQGVLWPELPGVCRPNSGND